MENFDLRWKAVETMLEKRFGKTPDMEGILFLIGINELENGSQKFSKEQKQELMHVAVCTLLSRRGYFTYGGHDQDGWPHFERAKASPGGTMQEQEKLLKECAIEYFGL